MTHADDGQIVPGVTPSTTPSTGQITASVTPSTGVIVARAASIAGLTLVGGALLRLLARLFEPLTVIAMTLPLTVVVTPVFVGVAIVQMVLWRKRTQASGQMVPLWVRVRRLCVTWLVLAVVATLGLLAIVLTLSVALDIDERSGIWVLAVAITVPMLVLGCAATAAVEAVYERRLRPAAVGDTDTVTS